MAEQLDIEAVREEISEKANELIGQAVEFAREKPHLAVGAAFGIGWILGNGLPPRVIMSAARLGWKAMLGGAIATSGLAEMFGQHAPTPPATGRTHAPRRSGGEGGSRTRNGATANKE